MNYDKENIHESNLKAVQPYLDDPEFEPDFIRSKSGAAAGICAWTINIIKFYHVFCDVEPKRQALAAANAELAAAEEKLSKIKAKISELDENLAELTASFEKVMISTDWRDLLGEWGHEKIVFTPVFHAHSMS